jgi:hypothetical protein
MFGQAFGIDREVTKWEIQNQLSQKNIETFKKEFNTSEDC